jgi:hypothetical protein
LTGDCKKNCSNRLKQPIALGQKYKKNHLSETILGCRLFIAKDSPQANIPSICHGANENQICGIPALQQMQNTTPADIPG